MPTEAQQRDNMVSVFNRYLLSNVIAGVDGCHIPFLEKPRGIPVGREPEKFRNRKGFWSLNAMILGGFDRRIYNINLGAPGSYHDSAVWTLSQAKAWFEVKFPQRYVLGDSAYAQSDFLMTPYSEAESRIDDNKCLFNIRHSSARVEMTENIYGMMKRRFPIVKYIRTKLRNAIRITTAAAILHNMALDCNDEVPDDDHPDCKRLKDIDDEVDELNRPIILNHLNPAERKTRAYQMRDNWRLGMDPIPTRKERGMMANHRVQAEIRRYARR